MYDGNVKGAKPIRKSAEYHYMWPNDKLPSLKCSFSWAMQQSAAVSGIYICSLQYDFMLTIFPYEIDLYDLAFCIDNNDIIT